MYTPSVETIPLEAPTDWWGGREVALTLDVELVELHHEVALLVEGHRPALLVELGRQEDAHRALLGLALVVHLQAASQLTAYSLQPTVTA